MAISQTIHLLLPFFKFTFKIKTCNCTYAVSRVIVHLQCEATSISFAAFWVYWLWVYCVFVILSCLSFLLCTAEFSPFHVTLFIGNFWFLLSVRSLPLYLVSLKCFHVCLFVSPPFVSLSCSHMCSCVRPHVLVCVLVYFLCYFDSLSSCVQCV